MELYNAARNIAIGARNIAIGAGALLVTEAIIRPNTQTTPAAPTPIVRFAEPQASEAQSAFINGPETKMSIEQRLGFAKSVLPDYFPDPVKYWAPEMKIWSTNYNIPIIWYAAIMVNESCGNPRAYNKSGDYGPFQVNAMHWGNTPVELRYDPDTNARLASSILKNAIARRNGDPYLSVLQYTAGQGSVDRGAASGLKQAYARRARDMITGKLSAETQSWLAGMKKSEDCRKAWIEVNRR